MNWFFAAYLIALAYLTVHKNGSHTSSLPKPWCWLAMLPITHFVFALFRAGNVRDTRDMVLIEIWANGFEWLFVGISMFTLAGVLKSDQTDTSNP